MSIPKTIHYCWFGGNPLPELAQKCIESWKTYLPDHEIIRWDETNFDITKMDFMKKAYEDKKWAFVSDVARLLVVYENGGIYFDTDVEVIRSYEDVLNGDVKAFLGFEKEGIVSSGLGFGAEKGNVFLKELLEIYRTIDYDVYKDSLSDIACPVLTTRLLEKYGLKKNNKMQVVLDVAVYPSYYFAPIDYQTGRLKKRKMTHSIHWYTASWVDIEQIHEIAKIQRLRACFGVYIGEKLYGIMSCMKLEGFWAYIGKRIKRFFK